MTNETQPRNNLVLETPQQVERALNDAYSTYFELKKVRKELGIARTLYPTHYESQLEMKLDPEVSAYMAAQNKATWDKIRPDNLKSIFVATLAPEKRTLFSKAAAEYGLAVRYQEPGINEDDMHDFADIKKVLLNWTPFHIASQKALRNAPSPHPWRITEPRTATDTIVTSGERIIHKPIDEQSAAEALQAISGSEVVVRTGIYFDMTTFNGHYLDWMGGSAIKIPIAQLTDAQITAFVREHHLDMMNIAGGIDYSGAAGQSLIDPTRFIEFVPIELGITDTHLDEDFEINWRDSLKLKNTAIEGITSHLKGAPIQPIEKIFKNLNEVYRSV